jgi:hypothetical protein
MSLSKTKMFQLLLQSKSLSHFEQHLIKRLDKEVLEDAKDVNHKEIINNT